MCSQVVMHLHNHVGATGHTVLTGVMKRRGSSQPVRNHAKVPSTADNNPFVLVLLADQEFSEGREEQAIFLLDAAYKAFDKKAKTAIYRRHPTT